jgi:hypothetical protein
MAIADEQLEDIARAYKVKVSSLPSGARLVEIAGYQLPVGWNRDVVTILFVLPPAFPAAPPDCFWVEPGGLRLENGNTPQNTNDANPIPEVGQRGTWFSWHLQDWNPNRNGVRSFFQSIVSRLNPPR